ISSSASGEPARLISPRTPSRKRSASSISEFPKRKRASCGPSGHNNSLGAPAHPSPGKSRNEPKASHLSGGLCLGAVERRLDFPDHGRKGLRLSVPPVRQSLHGALHAS